MTRIICVKRNAHKTNAKAPNFTGALFWSCLRAGTEGYVTIALPPTNRALKARERTTIRRA